MITYPSVYGKMVVDFLKTRSFWANLLVFGNTQTFGKLTDIDLYCSFEAKLLILSKDASLKQGCFFAFFEQIGFVLMQILFV